MRRAPTVTASAAGWRRPARTAPIAWALITFSVVWLIVGLVVLVRSRSVPVPETVWGVRGQEGIIAGAAVFVGGLLALTRPANRVSWLILASGAASGLQFVGGEYGLAALAAPAPGAAFAAWLGEIMWIPAAALLFETGLLFPNGDLLSPRWRYAVLAVALGSAATFSFFAVSPGPLPQLRYDNPFGLAAPPHMFVNAAILVRTVFGLGAILAVISLVRRYRVSGSDVRQQLKWIVVAGSFAAITSFVAMASSGVKPLELLSGVGIVVFLVSMTLAILRYRLYDIDIVINRALVYGPTTAMIGIVFYGGVVLLQAIVRPLTGGSDLAVAASTLASVALFQPLRRVTQSVVDRRFYRSRYDAERTLDAFSARLRDEVDLEAVRADLVDAVASTVQPSHASVWLRKRAGDDTVTRPIAG